MEVFVTCTVPTHLPLCLSTHQVQAFANSLSDAQKLLDQAQGDVVDFRQAVYDMYTNAQRERYRILTYLNEVGR